ncbi:putative membrane protein [Bacteroides fragilis str. 2-F-2 |nr:putative membrane protein [Bacteroides fragilis str. 2-F-2 \
MEYYNNEDCKEKGIHKSRKISGVLLAVSVLILTFLPSTKEMYRIMGIGGTIDYIRQNETAKQLPDKCIKALDLFMDKVIEDGNDNKTLE